MARTEAVSWAAILVFVICCLGSASPGMAQMTVVIMEPTTSIPTACVVTIKKVGSPNLSFPTSYVYIDKFLDTTRVCSFVTSNFAALCNPGGMVATTRLIASATGTGLTMSPSCQWNCVGCGTITTSAANDGLPVELMDFRIEDGDTGGDQNDQQQAEKKPDRGPSSAP